jgi:4-hydroxybenzoate polyprenyltransferase
MLCVQFGIGIANDLADVVPDAASKPYKPLARGVVPKQPAVIATVVLCVAGLALAASVSLATLAFFAGGLAAGMGYDLGLRRTPLSPVPWWAGIGLLPMAAFAAAGAVTPRLWPVLPLSGLVALGLHCANAAPDAAGDRRAGQRSLPALLGEQASLRVSVVALTVVVVFGLAVASSAHRLSPWVIGGALVLLLAVVAVIARGERRPFPILAAGTAVFASTWLATVAGN